MIWVVLAILWAIGLLFVIALAKAAARGDAVCPPWCDMAVPHRHVTP